MWQSGKQLSADLIDGPCVWVIWLERPVAQSEAGKGWSNSSAWFRNTDSFSLPSRMCWSSQSRNTPTITCSSCVSSASASLSLITPCCFSAMKNCLFRNGKSSKSKVVMVQHLTKVSEKRVQTSHLSVWNGMKGGSKKGEGGTVRLATGGRHLWPGESNFRRKAPGLCCSHYVPSLDFPGSKLQFKGLNIVSFINVINIQWTPVVRYVLLYPVNILHERNSHRPLSHGA